MLASAAGLEGSQAFFGGVFWVFVLIRPIHGEMLLLSVNFNKIPCQELKIKSPHSFILSVNI